MDGDAPCCCPRTWLTASISSFKTRTSCASGTPHDQRWLLAIESVYQKAQPANAAPVHASFSGASLRLDVMYELCIERSTFYAWREQILMQIAVAAVESGAMQIFYD